MKIINITILLLAFSSFINGSGLNIIVNTNNEETSLSNTRPELAEAICSEAANAMITSIKNFFDVTHSIQQTPGGDFKCDITISTGNEEKILTENSDCIVTINNERYIFLRPNIDDNLKGYETTYALKNNFKCSRFYIGQKNYEYVPTIEASGMRANILEANDKVLEGDFKKARDDLKTFLRRFEDRVGQLSSLATSPKTGKKVSPEVHKKHMNYENENLNYVKTNLAYCLFQSEEFKEALELLNENKEETTFKGVIKSEICKNQQGKDFCVVSNKKRHLRKKTKKLV
jgi:hypothetical protein